MAPKLQTDDGGTVLNDLSPAEIERLRDLGVEVEVNPDGDGDGTPGDDGTGETGDGDDTKPDDGDGDGKEGDADDGSADDTGDGPETRKDTGSPGDGTVEKTDEIPENNIEERDLSDTLAEEYHVDMDSVRAPDERDKVRWESLLDELSKYGNNIEKRKRERDERADGWATKRTHDTLREEVRQSGVIEELEEGFRQLVSRPTPRPARSGPEIDMGNVTRRASGDMTVRELFKEDVKVETGDRCIGFCTDISGSMGSDILDLKKTGAIIAQATEIIGDAFVWEAFTDEGRGGLDLRIVTGPNEDFEWRHLDSFTSESNEPTAAGIRDCRMLMERTSKRDHVMVVVTDGKALVGEDGEFYGGSSPKPVADARSAVQECREQGVEVIGLGIGGMSEPKMRDTFGEGNYKLTSIRDLADDVIDLYDSQMDVTRRH